jgi:DNA polymerase III alpha subunit
LGSIEQLAQLLSLWKPGAYNKEHEQAHFDARFAARERPSYPDPSMAAVLDPTSGQVLYAVM